MWYLNSVHRYKFIVQINVHKFLAPTGAQGVKMYVCVCVCDFLQKRTLGARPQVKAPWKGQGSSRERAQERAQ